MRQLTRPTLGPRTLRYFADKTRQIRRKRKQARWVEEAHRLWTQGRSTKAVRDAVELLHVMNDGLDTCMYCEHDRATVYKNLTRRAIIEHWEPVARSPLRTFDWTNHFLACHRCNSFLKETEFPTTATGAPLLLHPVDDDPMAHLTFIPSTGALRARDVPPHPPSPKGEKTIETFHLEDFDKSRKAVWMFHLALLEDYDREMSAKNHTAAEEIKKEILGSDHRSILYHLVTIALGPNGATLTTANMPTIVSRYNVGSWR